MDKKKNGNKSVLFVVNPGAGAGMPGDFEEQLREFSVKAGWEYRILKLQDGSGKKQVKEKLDERKPDMVVACGGDGTVNLVAEMIIDRSMTMGIVPLGSSNGLAYELGIPDNPEEALNILLREESRKLDIIRINDRYLCLHISDIGMNARVVKHFQKDNLRGLLGYAKHYFRVLGKIRKFSCTLAEHDQSVSNVLMVVIANASYYGTGAIVNPEGQVDDGRFEIILVRFSLLKFLLRLFIHWFSRKRKQEEAFRIFPSTKEEITIRPPQELQVDGEPIGKVDRVTVEVLPQKIEVLHGSEPNPS